MEGGEEGQTDGRTDSDRPPRTGRWAGAGPAALPVSAQIEPVTRGASPPGLSEDARGSSSGRRLRGKSKSNRRRLGDKLVQSPGRTAPRRVRSFLEKGTSFPGPSPRRGPGWAGASPGLALPSPPGAATGPHPAPSADRPAGPTRGQRPDELPLQLRGNRGGTSPSCGLSTRAVVLT